MALGRREEARAHFQAAQSEQPRSHVAALAELRAAELQDALVPALSDPMYLRWSRATAWRRVAAEAEFRRARALLFRGDGAAADRAFSAIAAARPDDPWLRAAPELLRRARLAHLESQGEERPLNAVKLYYALGKERTRGPFAADLARAAAKALSALGLHGSRARLLTSWFSAGASGEEAGVLLDLFDAHLASGSPRRAEAVLAYIEERRLASPDALAKARARVAGSADHDPAALAREKLLGGACEAGAESAPDLLALETVCRLRGGDSGAAPALSRLRAAGGFWAAYADGRAGALEWEARRRRPAFESNAKFESDSRSGGAP
jgi:hypothetical protein